MNTCENIKKAVVTGANGFVGSALCKELSANGIETIAVVKDEKSNIDSLTNLPNLRIVFCDFSEYPNFDNIVNDEDVDVLFHFSWMGTSGNLRGDVDVQLDCICGSCELIKACARMKIKRFVFAASLMEYEIDRLMQSDKTPGKNTIYCSAKLSADYIGRTLAGSLGIEYIRGIISNVYGPGENSPRLINTSIRKLLKKEHCSFSPGEQTYDFIYISDAAKSFVSIADKGIPNRTYYIGSQNPRPLKEFLIEMKDVVDKDAQIGLGEISFDGISLSYNEFDIFAIKNDTGFVAEIPFSEGIARTLKWIKENE